LPVSHKKTYVWGDWFTNYKMVHEPKSISQWTGMFFRGAYGQYWLHMPFVWQRNFVSPHWVCVPQNDNYYCAENCMLSHRVPLHDVPVCVCVCVCVWCDECS
jgi:hypothetical protein